MPGKRKPLRFRHYADVKIFRTKDTPSGDGWVTEDGRFTFWRDPAATKRCAHSHPVGGHSGAKCPGGAIHSAIWWYAVDNTTQKNAFGSMGAGSLTDAVILVKNGLNRKGTRISA